jgi:2,4-dienoyl-CoA reductase-like NADH-dependent reductase (Old Yellow Enzyme family)
MIMNIFSEYSIGKLKLKNRIVRSATYEGCADINGFPTHKYTSMYKTLAKNNVGMIITGFAFVSKDGRAMQPAQAGIDNPEKIEYFRKATDEVHKYDCPIIIQMAHSGRQTLSQISGSIPVSCTDKSSIYFRQQCRLINIGEIKRIINSFADSAYYAKEAGFDGVQLHAGHGYLLHQFIMPETNKLTNEYGISMSTGIGTRVIEEIFDKIKEKCGKDFPVLIKISGSHDLGDSFNNGRFDNLIEFLDRKRFDAIEISYGTMDYALNIFRGDMDLKTVFEYNPIFKTNSKIKKYLYTTFIDKYIRPKLIDFSAMYNLHFAERAKQITSIPIITVGGFRRRSEIEYAISEKFTDLVSLSRPFICEPNFVNEMMKAVEDHESKCINCNQCVFMCDSGKVTACYGKGESRLNIEKKIKLDNTKEEPHPYPPPRGREIPGNSPPRGRESQETPSPLGRAGVGFL